MPHVLVAGKLHPSGLALLDASPGITYDYVEEISEPSYAPLIERADGLVIRTQPLSASTIARAPNLKIVSRHGVGYDSVHLPSLNARGIALAVVGDVNSVSVAEHAMMLLLAASKRALRADRSVRQGDWAWRNRMEATELAGKILLIIGYGRIGRCLARIASGFGMVVTAYDPFVQQQGWPQGQAMPVVDLLQGLATADAVSIHTPKSDNPVIGAEELAVLRPSAIVVNTARGGAVDEKALAVALREGRIAAAALDVFDEEPPRRDNPLLHFEQVVLTPHSAALTAECGARMAVSSVKNILDFFDKRIDPSLVVNRAFINGC
jgi:D-3-phosphoglycerate dehydrogenase / 2-oxoglutarate reductase